MLLAAKKENRFQSKQVKIFSQNREFYLAKTGNLKYCATFAR